MDFYISIFIGFIHAIIFNPFDKANYSSIVNNNSIMCRNNWIKPFTGTINGIYTNIISSGLYVYLVNYTKFMNIYEASFTICIITSLVLNPFNILKCRSYSNNLSLYNSFLYNYNTHGMKFVKIGIESLILRDFLFNIIYLHYKKNNNELFYNCFIICSASIISSPLHYVRNMKYYNNDSYINIIKKLFKNNEITNPLYIFKLFGIGYGTARTILSIYSGQLMFSMIKEHINYK
jgi:hypothetical protein